MWKLGCIGMKDGFIVRRLEYEMNEMRIKMEIKWKFCVYEGFIGIVFILPQTQM